MYIANDVKKLDNVESCQVALSNGGKDVKLTYLHNGDSKSIKISKKLAEVLIANGMSYEG